MVGGEGSEPYQSLNATALLNFFSFFFFATFIHLSNFVEFLGRSNMV